MGGTIGVCSRQGKGTLFCVSLPLQPGLAEPHDGEQQPEYHLPPLRLLVADDVEQNLELIVALLGSRNHRITTVENGQQAVERYRQGCFDAVLLDVQMPVMNGHEACRAIRAYEHEHRRKPVPIIALTASVTEEDRRQARDAGMNGFAVKPLEIQEITRELARLTGAPAERIMRNLPVQPAHSPVIDSERIVALWGTRHAHARALARFLADEKNTPAHLQALLQDMQTRHARDAVHRIKGTAGNLCLTELYSVLADLENQLQGQRIDSARRILPRMQAALAAARMHLSTVPPDPDQPAPATQEAGPSGLPALQQLIQKLRRGEMPGDMLASLRHELPADVFEHAQEALDNFEPEAAASILGDYAHHLSSESHADD
jgi:CheY-like chemotaxis protein